MKNIKLQGAKNIRDFGGIVNREGRRIKEKRFLRSSALDGLTKKDRQILTEDYRLGEIIDLRTDEESAALRDETKLPLIQEDFRKIRKKLVDGI